MGFLNPKRKGRLGKHTAQLVTAIQRATAERNDGDKMRLENELREVQAACAHPETEYRTITLGQRESARYKKGDTISWCFRCGKCLRHNGIDVAEELPLTMWERILDNDDL